MLSQVPLDFTRQVDLIDPELLRGTHLDVVGVGALGSVVAFLASRLGTDNVRLFDSDRVEPINVSQLYRLAGTDVGELKVRACQSVLRDFSGLEAEAVAADGTDKDLRGVVLSCLDGMEARHHLWTHIVRERVPQVELLIDGRIGGESGTVFTVRPCDPPDCRYYERTALYSDEQALPLSCTAGTVGYCSFYAAAIMARQLARAVSHRPPERRIDFDLSALTMGGETA